MRVYNLACSNEHKFEGWFGSSEDFERQRERGLIQCPVCDCVNISKRPHAPAVVRGKSALDSENPRDNIQAQADAWLTDPRVPMDAKLAAIRAALSHYIRANTEDVGTQFAQEARAMYRNEKPQRAIRGSATIDETQALLDEGIPVLPIPFRLDGSEIH